MSELPPPERLPEPMRFDPVHDRLNPDRKPNPRSGEIPGTLPPTRDLRRDLLGQTVGGRYLIKGVLGEGGMGTVYDAEHLGLSRQVAIKVLSPAQARKRVAVKRFQQEARAAGAIGHPNICEVYDLGLLDDGRPYLVMEKLVGQTLADRIAKEGGLPFDDVVEVMVQVLSGLVAAHEKGIIHRDIKPENIFLARRVGCPPIIKLLDFGVSKMMPEFQTGEDSLDLTRTGMVMGTPYYMSPEQARGERNLDGRVDVYACGVVMYEAIAGRRPFLAPNYNALLLAIINTSPRPLRELRPKTPPELEAIIMKAMAKNRDDRFASAKHFLRELAPPSPIAEGSTPRLAPLVDGSPPRVPPPPTAEERKRAPVLGGGRAPGSRRSDPPLAATSSRGRRHEPPPQVALYREPSERPDAPSAMLRSRMTDPAQNADRERATRVDVRPKLIPAPYDAAVPRRPSQPPPSPLPVADSDDVDIPIHVVGDEEDVEDPTEIFRAGVHLMPRPRPPVSSPASSTRGDAQAEEPRSKKRASSRPPPRMAAVPDDWEGETIVKRPEFEPELDPRASMGRAPSQRRGADPRPVARRRDPRAFNPDETMKLDNTGEIELSDERHAPPRRR
jgi:serine/threonine-protein kinase